MRIFTLIAVLLTMLPTGASALTAGELAKKCTDSLQQGSTNQPTQETAARLLDAGSCAGFVGGVISGVNLVGNLLRQQDAMKRNFICLPQNTHAQALVRVVIEHITAHSEDKNVPAELAVYKAMILKFPCQTPK